MAYREWGYFGAKSKVYDVTIKRVGKEHPIAMSDILRNKIINTKKVAMK